MADLDRLRQHDNLHRAWRWIRSLCADDDRHGVADGLELAIDADLTRNRVG